ncbi:hypothetical protein ZWY2020_059074 [Hordeum vulgare]|nr:hypothetical protein ZWY2020_059074 [Hordeum vulgare]
MVFPSAYLLHLAKSSGKLLLPLKNITIKERDTIHEEVVLLSIPEFWVRLHGIPKKHRDAERMMEGLKILDLPIVVDELSLIWLGPMRMKLVCRAPDKLNSFVQVWFNHEGYDIKAEVERLLKFSGDGPEVPGPNDGPPRSSHKRGLLSPGAWLDRGLGCGRGQV